MLQDSVVEENTARKILFERTGETELKLSWPSVEGAVSYIVYQRDRESEEEAFVNTEGNEIVVSIEKDTDYAFRIVPMDETANPMSDQLILQTVWYGSFGISGKTSDISEKEIWLKWKNIKTADQYKIFILRKNEWREEETDSNNSYFMLDSCGKEYKVQVRAYDEEGDIMGCSEAVKLSLPKKMQSLFTTVKSSGKVILSWKPSAGASKYLVYRKKASGSLRLLKQTKKTSCVVQFQKKAVTKYKVIPIYQKDSLLLTGRGKIVSLQDSEIVSLGHQKYSYSEMVQDIRLLTKKYHNYVTYESLGTTRQGRAIYDVVLGNQDASHTILVVSAIHAREYATTVVCMKQLEYYLQNYNKTVDGKRLSNVFSKCNIHYVMMANPDGVVYSQTRSSQWKGNSRGINLNRNFPYSFKREGKVSDNSYTGPYGASEKETKMIIHLTKKLNKSSKLAVLNYHAMGNIVFGGYSGRNSELRTQTKKLYWISRNATGYRDSGGADGGAHGTYRDYLLNAVKVPSITIEIGSVSCPLPQYTYASCFSRNRLVVLREAGYWKNVR